MKRRGPRAIDPLALTDVDVAVLWSLLVMVNWESVDPLQLRMVRAFRDATHSSLVLPGEAP